MGLFSSRKSADGVKPVDASNLIAEGALLIDVREPYEWQAGHAPKAKHIALGAVGHRTAELPKDRILIMVCRSGRRSALATDQLREVGFTVLNLTGGMQAWEAAGLPVVVKGGRTGRVI